LLSVVVPARDAAPLLRETLPALTAALPPGAELIVVDDGSRDGSAEVARGLGAHVVLQQAGSGPAAARNRGAAAARGELLVFLDADVRVHADTLELLLAPLAEPGIAASFGSYDAAPAARSWVSLYKNLSHHFVHQRSRPQAATFWAACGAIRRTAFESAGGFDERYRRPSIEDVELGYRLRASGYRIRLVARAQVTHLKRWSLASWLACDLRDRSIPWARLLRGGRGLPWDLNFTLRDRAASLLVGLMLASLAASLLDPRLLALAAAAALAAMALDAALLRFLAAQVSLPFAAFAALLQLLHRVVGLIGLAIGLASPGPATCQAPSPRPKIEGS
jgi:GT2 family glycosyltransferase